MMVLIIDRSKIFTDRIIGLINEAIEGISFQHVVSYTETINLLQSFKPDAVLLDLNYPGNLGFELLKGIKTENKETVVIGLYTDIDERRMKLYRESGADFIFDKYSEYEKIPPVINSLYNQQNLQIKIA